MANEQTTKRAAGLRRLVRAFGKEFAPGYHAAGLTFADAWNKHQRLFAQRYGVQAGIDYMRDGLTLAEADAVHVVRQQAEIADLATQHEQRVAELVAEHKADRQRLVDRVNALIENVAGEMQACFDANMPTKPRTLRERIAAALSALFD